MARRLLKGSERTPSVDLPRAGGFQSVEDRRWSEVVSNNDGTGKAVVTPCLIRVPAREMVARSVSSIVVDQRCLGGFPLPNDETGASKLPPCGAFEFETVYCNGIPTTVNDNSVFDGRRPGPQGGGL